MILLHVTIFRRRYDKHRPKYHIYFCCKVSIKYFSVWIYFCNEATLTKKYLLLWGSIKFFFPRWKEAKWKLRIVLSNLVYPFKELHKSSVPERDTFVPGSWGSQISRKSSHEVGNVVRLTPPLLPGNIPGTHFCWSLSQALDRKNFVNEKLQWQNRESNPRLSGL